MVRTCPRIFSMKSAFPCLSQYPSGSNPSALALEVSIRHIRLLHDEDDAHRVWTTVVRGRDEGCVLLERVLEVVEHLAVTRRLHDIRERGSAIAEDICDDDHVVIAFILV